MSVALEVAIAGCGVPAQARVAPVANGGSDTGALRQDRSPPVLAESGKVRFWECPAVTTELLVAVNTLTLHPGTTLDVSFTVKNESPVSCNYTAPYASVEPGPTSNALQAGPCGSIGFEILDRFGREVWPGPQVVNCPALGFAQLAPGATVSGTGTWNQTRPNSTSRVRAGTYTLVVDNGRFRFRVHVVRV